jgi:hypothetical protein
MPPLYDLESLRLQSSWKADDTNVDVEKRSVHFASHVSVYEIDKVEEEDRFCYWMCKEEYVVIRGNCTREVRLALQQCATASANFRGLEHKTPQGLYRRFQNRMRAAKVVLEEQKRQKQSGFSDPDWIATLYKEVCHRSAMESKIMGMRDEVALNHDYVLSVGPNLHDLKKQTITHFKESQRVEL